MSIFRAVSVASIALTTACGEDLSTIDAQLALVAGDYTAEGAFGSYLLTTASGGEVVDWLEQGASISLQLLTDGTTTGRVFAPGGAEDGGDFDEDLAGTWTIAGGVVRFSHDADTFLRDMDFAFDDGTLLGEETFGSVTIRLAVIRL
jgi:hypothetical protein